MSLFVIVATVIGMIGNEIISNAYSLDYNEQVLDQKNNLWHLGKNLSVGDSYTYKICDPKTIQTSASNYHYFTQGYDDHNSSTCYTIKLDFVNLLTPDENQINGQRDVWVVQVAIDEQNDLRYSVFHIDTLTFEVTSADTIHPDTKKYADSLQKTLFSLFKYTVSESQLLQIGEDWGEVTEALQPRGENPYVTVLNDNQEFSVIQNEIIRLIDKKIEPVTRDITDAFEVGYEIDIQDPVIFDQKKNKLVSIDKEDTNNVTTSFLISSQLPFPLSGESYNPVYLAEPQKEFEFELLVFQTNNKNIDLEIKPVVDKELPPTETGFIKLAIPDNIDNDIENNDDDIVDDNDPIPEDNELEVIPDDDDNDVTDNVSDDTDVVSDDNVADYTKIGGLVILLVVMIAGFVIFKRFRESGFKNTLLKRKPRQHQVKKAVIPFDDKLHIDIKSLKQ
ncbi:hypothetical protein [Nitrosopumilus sp.]|uniref:hypothetical protein n=1 Tax=Nitrosopumilus sp. TaxID=2024843 RepID=UPI00292CF1F0|nr:hypothetical protein [Nitrosopumilus sp.]